jgi:hypothetical protein
MLCQIKTRLTKKSAWRSRWARWAEDRRLTGDPCHPKNDAADARRDDAKHDGKDERLRLHSFGDVTGDDEGLR